MSIQENNLPVYLQKFKVLFKNDSGKLGYSNVGLLPTSTPFARSWSITLACTLFPQENKNRIYDFDYDLSEVIFDPSRFVVSFNGPVQGFAFIGENKDVINLQHNLTYTYNFEQRKLSFSLRIPCSIKEPTISFLNMYIDDSDVAITGFYFITTLVPPPTTGAKTLYYLVKNDDSDLEMVEFESLFSENNPTWIFTPNNNSNNYVIASTDGFHNGQITNDFLQPIDSCTNVQLSNLQTYCSDPTALEWIVSNNSETEIQADCGNYLTVDAQSLDISLQTSSGNTWSLIPVFQSFFPYGSETPTTFFPYTISYVSNGTTYYLGVDEDSDRPIMTTGTPITDTTLQWYMTPIVQICNSPVPAFEYTIQNVSGYTTTNNFLISTLTDQPSPSLSDACICESSPCLSSSCQNGQFNWMVEENKVPASSFFISTTLLSETCEATRFYLCQNVENNVVLTRNSGSCYWYIAPLNSYPTISCS